MREYVKKRDVMRAFATIRPAMTGKCDRLTERTDEGNALGELASLPPEVRAKREFEEHGRYWKA